jgi:hypothetical protein
MVATHFSNSDNSQLLSGTGIKDDTDMLPTILVWNQIGDMLGGETGKFACRKNKVKMWELKLKNSAFYRTYIGTLWGYGL